MAAHRLECCAASIEQMRKRRKFLSEFDQALASGDRSVIEAAIDAANASGLLEQQDLDRAHRRYEEMANAALQAVCKTRRLSKLGPAIVTGLQDGAGEVVLEEARALMIELRTTQQTRPRG